MSRNHKPEFAVNERTKTKKKPVYIAGLKIPTPGNSSFQCWCVAIFTIVGYHCYITNFSFYTHPISNSLGVFFCSVTLYCLWKTWSTHAGTVPEKGWDKEDDSLVNSYNRPFCDKCQKYKPERTHHCKVCDICVLKMDHHCPFTDSCVGWSNYKYYFCLLVWGTVTMTAYLIVTGVTVWRMVWGSPEGEPEVAMNWYLLLDFIAIVIADGTLANLLVTHLVFITIDKTTIEWQETKELGNLFSYWGNLRMWYTCVQRALGANPLMWFVPTRSGIDGDGINFGKPFFRRVPRGSKDDPHASAYNAAQASSSDAQSPPMPEPVHSEV